MRFPNGPSQDRLVFGNRNKAYEITYKAIKKNLVLCLRNQRNGLTGSEGSAEGQERSKIIC